MTPLYSVAAHIMRVMVEHRLLVVYWTHWSASSYWSLNYMVNGVISAMLQTFGNARFAVAVGHQIY
jgi:hypothetical protein